MSPEDTARLQRIRAHWTVTGITESHSDARFLLRLLDAAITEHNTFIARLVQATTELDQQRAILGDLHEDLERANGFAAGREKAIDEMITWMAKTIIATPFEAVAPVFEFAINLRFAMRPESPPSPQKPQSPDLPL